MAWKTLESPVRLAFKTQLFWVCLLSAYLIFSSQNLKIKAQIAGTLNFQGKIVNVSTGTNVTTGTPACVKSGADSCDFQVRIWNHQTNTVTTPGGNLLFTQTFQDVEIGSYNGVFNLTINSCGSSEVGNSQWGTTTGNCTVIDDSDTDSDPGVNFNRNDLYIEVSFATTDTPSSLGSFSEVFTRKPITSVPSAFASQIATKVWNLSDVIEFNDINTQAGGGPIALSDGTYNTLPNGYTSILQALNAASGGGGGLWTINGNVTYLTSSGSDLSLSSTLVSPFSVDESENLIRIGEGTGTNGKLDFYSATGNTGRFEYISDTLAWSGGGFRINDDTEFSFGNTDDIRLYYDEANDDRLEFTDGTNLLLAITDGGNVGNMLLTGNADILGGTLGIGSNSQVGSVSIFDGSSNKITLISPSLGSDYTLTLPTTDGDPNQVLQTNGSGVLSWVNSGFILVGDSGTNQTISAGDTLTIIGGLGVSTQTTNTDTITLNFDTTDNLDITGDWEFQDAEKLLFGSNADIDLSFDGTDTFNITDGTNNLFSLIDLGTTARIRLGSGTNDLLATNTTGVVSDNDLYWGNDLLCDVSETNCGWASITGSSKWTDGGSTTYLTDTADDLAVGGTSSAAPLFFDTSTGLLALGTDGVGGGVQIGSDTNLYRSAANTLRTPDNFTVDGILQATSGLNVTAGGANFTGGDVFIQSNSPLNLILDNSTTSSDAASGLLILRGNDWDGVSTNTEVDFRIGTVISTTTDYRLSFFNDNGSTEVASLDESGNLQMDGRINFASNTGDVLGVNSSGSGAPNDLYWGDDLLCDSSEVDCGWVKISSGASSKWTDTGAITYLTETTDDLAIGGSSSASPLFFDTSAGLLVLNTDGAGSGIQIGSDTNLYRSATNLLRTPDSLTVDGTLTASTGANVTGGDLQITGTTPFSAIIDNTTTGADAASGLLILRGNDWNGSTNTEIDIRLGTSITSTTDYKLAFYNDDGVSEVGSIDESGNLQIDGRLNLGTNTNDLLSVGTAGASANGDLYWGDDLVCDVSEANCGWGAGGGSLFTDGGAVTYLTQTADDLAIGGTGLNSPFSVDVSANTVRIGDGTTSNSVLNMFAQDGDTGSVSYTTNDRWEFSGGSILLQDDYSLNLGTDADFFMNYDEATDDRVEFGFGANQFGYINDVAAQSYGDFSFSGTTKLGSALAGNETALLIDTASGFSGKLLDLNINGVDIFEVSAVGLRAEVPATFASAGNVQIANNLQFTNSTASFITSESPLYIVAGDSAANEDLVLRANNSGYVIVDDRLEVTDKILLGDQAGNFLATTSQIAPTTNLYWGNKVLCDVSAVNCANSLFSDGGTISYLTATTDDFAVGGSSLTASLSVDVSDNLLRLGTGSTANGKFDLYSSNGNNVRFEMTTADILELNNGGFIFNQLGDAVDFVIEGDTDSNLFVADGSADSVGIGTNTPNSKLQVLGSIALKRISTAGNASTSDEVIIAVTDTTAPRTITLNTSDNVEGRVIIIKDESGGAAGNNITIDTQGSETIDGQNSISISTNYGSVRLYSNGTNWFNF